MESVESVKSIESIEPIESIESIESVESCRVCRVYTRATQKTANIHTTHKGELVALAHVFPFVCGVNVGGLLFDTCVSALGTLYLNHMSVNCKYANAK